MKPGAPGSLGLDEGAPRPRRVCARPSLRAVSVPGPTGTGPQSRSPSGRPRPVQAWPGKPSCSRRPPGQRGRSDKGPALPEKSHWTPPTPCGPAPLWPSGSWGLWAHATFRAAVRSQWSLGGSACCGGSACVLRWRELSWLHGCEAGGCRLSPRAQAGTQICPLATDPGRRQGCRSPGLAASRAVGRPGF